MKYSIYARESSSDTNKAPPIEHQIKLGKEWGQDKELIHIFADNGFSGGDWKRPEWLRSIREAKRHTYMVLWIFNQDRLARDTEQFLYFYRKMKEAHVKIFDHTMNDFINMEDLGGRVKHTTLAQASEIYRLVISDKVKARYKSMKARNPDGIVWGRPQKKIDYNRVFELRSQGLGYRSIAREIGGVSYQTIRKILLNGTNK